MNGGKTTSVRRACQEFLKTLSRFYGVRECGIRVLAARPLRVRENWTSELFGDYTPETTLIRVWMRTLENRLAAYQSRCVIGSEPPRILESIAEVDQITLVSLGWYDWVGVALIWKFIW
jgi:hypothetical protein